MCSLAQSERALRSEEGSPRPRGMWEHSEEEIAATEAEGSCKSEAYCSDRVVVAVLVMLSSNSKFKWLRQFLS